MRLNRLIAIGVASAALLTGCSVGGSSDSAEPAVGGYSEEGLVGMDAAAVEEEARAADGGSAAQDMAAPEAVSSSSDYLVREASLGIKVDTIAEAATRVREIAFDAGGSVTSEQFGDGFYGPAESDITRYGTMTISVPSDELEAAIERLTELGEVRSRSSNAYDVQDEYIDVEARIATLEASIGRMRALMDRTEDIEQIVALETALSARQADLDSLQARLNSLDQRIAMSPITVMLTTTDDLGEPEGGIIGALKDAWNAFTTSAAVLVTTIGALLPWLVVGAFGLWALLAAVRAVRRRREHTASARTAPEPGVPTPADEAAPATTDPDARA